MVCSLTFDGACVGWRHGGIHETRIVLRDDVENGIVVIVEIESDGVQVPYGKIAIGDAPSPVEMEKSVAVVSVADERVATTAIPDILYGLA